ncbi:methyltransferase family protein [Nesterenkonia ebinurensis]|uniref:methyltransferase family protein n=1 Tax=Nesterenkonia ebinurensis TaxID=2608252 RepID=UPI00123DE84A|nr:isoprenylcysteine carboxylmethyltransferase family protein [Nesterenkonia ebinurensis]
MNLKQVHIPPAVVLAAAGGAQLLVPKKPVRLFRGVGAAIMGVASAGMLGASISRFRQHETTVNPVNPEQASALVTDGPNAISRNPMYLGMTGLLCAHALWRGTWRSVFPAALFYGWIDRVQIPPEENALEEHFGQSYRDYRSGVPRWIGVVKSS